MFSLEENNDGFNSVVLTDNDSGTRAVIVPSCGAILHHFSIQKNGKAFNVIDSYVDAADFQNNCTSKGFLGCKLSPFVCRVKNGNYHFGQNDYQFEKFYLGENALHGLIYDAVFEVTEKSIGADHARVALRYEYGGYDPGYPFRYQCEVTHELRENNALTVTTVISNIDEGLIPMADGWHPYFTLGKKIDELQFEFQSKEMVEFDEQLIPTGKLIPYQEYGSLKKMKDQFFDNCFTLNFAECQPLCVLRNAEEGIQIEIIPDQSYPYLQVYTPPHRNTIAIENLSAAPDAFNNNMGITILEPGHSRSFSTTYKITRI
jgi:aldose 1-epimerase